MSYSVQRAVDLPPVPNRNPVSTPVQGPEKTWIARQDERFKEYYEELKKAKFEKLKALYTEATSSFNDSLKKISVEITNEGEPSPFGMLRCIRAMKCMDAVLAEIQMRRDSLSYKCASYVFNSTVVRLATSETVLAGAAAGSCWAAALLKEEERDFFEAMTIGGVFLAFAGAVTAIFASYGEGKHHQLYVSKREVKAQEFFTEFFSSYFERDSANCQKLLETISLSAENLIKHRAVLEYLAKNPLPEEFVDKAAPPRVPHRSNRMAELETSRILNELTPPDDSWFLFADAKALFRLYFPKDGVAIEI